MPTPKLLDYGDWIQPEDRWLRFALRLSFVMFVVALQTVVVIAVAIIVLNLK